MSTLETPIETRRLPLGQCKQDTLFELPDVVKTDQTVHQRINAVKAANYERRKKKIQERFDELYEKDRKRYDDVIKILCEEFALSDRTIQAALKG